MKKMGKYEKIISHEANGAFYSNTLKILNIIGGGSSFVAAAALYLKSPLLEAMLPKRAFVVLF